MSDLSPQYAPKRTSSDIIAPQPFALYVPVLFDFATPVVRETIPPFAKIDGRFARRA